MTPLSTRRAHQFLLLRVQRDDLYTRPVASLFRPAPWVLGPGLLVNRMTAIENIPIMSVVAICGADVPNAAVQMLMVVPVHKLACPSPGGIQISEPLDWKLRPVLGGAKQALDESIIVTHTRPRVRGLDLQPEQHCQHGARLEGRTVIAVQNGFGLQGMNILGQCRAFDQVRGVGGVGTCQPVLSQ